MVMPAGQDIVYERPLRADRQGRLRTPYDPKLAKQTLFFDFGGAAAIQTVLTVATVAPGAARILITGLAFYNANGATNLVLLYDGGAAAANRVFVQLTIATVVNLFISEEQLGGGLPIVTDLRVDPSQNNLEMSVTYEVEFLPIFDQ